MKSRLSKIKRCLKMGLKTHKVAFLWGPRQVGKSTFLKQKFANAKFFDLLDTDLATQFALRPKILREELLAAPQKIVIIDEVQKVPAF